MNEEIRDKYASAGVFNDE